MEKIQESQEEIDRLISLYLIDKLSNKALAKEMGKSVDWCVRILKENNAHVTRPEIEINKKGDLKAHHNQLKDKRWKELQKGAEIEWFFKENTDYTAICKETGKEFGDFENRAGALTVHLSSIFPDLIIPSTRDRREIYKTTKTPWHAQFFNFKVAPKIEKDTVSCLECGWETTDIENSGGWLTGHIKTHNIRIQDYVQKHPEQKHLFTTALAKEYRRTQHEGKQEGVD
jgi:hypothetical protein